MVSRFVSMVSLVSCTSGCVCVCFRALLLGVERQALHPPPSPAATSALAAASSEEEGLHARPLPHILGDYFCNVAVFFGGGRIGTFSLPPHIDEEFLGGREQALFLTMPASTSEEEGQALLLTNLRTSAPS